MWKNIAALLLLAAGSNALAQEGTLDTSFAAPAGYWIQSFVGTASEDVNLEAVLVQPDQKIVLCAGVHAGSAGSVHCSRLGPDGFPDGGFQEVILPAANFAARVAGVARQSSGKIVLLTKEFGEAANEAVLWRINTDGSIDTSFGSGGKRIVAYTLGSGTFTPADLLMLSDDRMVVTGSIGAPLLSVGNVERAFATMRLNADGSIDTSYGTGGRVIVTRFAEVAGTFPRDRMRHGELLPDGGVILAGGAAAELFCSGAPGPGAGCGYTYKVGVAKLLASGALDPAFGDGGVAIFDIGALPPQLGASDVARDAQGRFYVGTGGETYSSTAGTLLRFRADGVLDFGFGLLGRAQLDFADPFGPAPVPAAIHALMVQPDGRVIAAGSATGSGVTFLVAARIDTDGYPDPGFGIPSYGPGFFANRALGGLERATALAVQNGKPLLAGGVEHATPNRWAIVYRLTVDAMFANGFE